MAGEAAQSSPSVVRSKAGPGKAKAPKPKGLKPKEPKARVSKPKKEKPETPQDRLKKRVADELGLMEKIRLGGWGNLTAAESGRIGGVMTRLTRQGLIRPDER